MRSTITGTWVLCAALLAACGGAEETSAEGADEPTAGDEAEATTTEAEGPALAEMAWQDVPEDLRGRWMSEVVVPTMEPLFQEHDPERFAEFGCPTCHGENAREVQFQMPNGIAPLDPAAVPAMFESDQPMAQFTTQTVWPRMGELLGEELYDMETGEGFSCFHCHGRAESEGG